jgi:hypothetical protein
MKHIIVLCFIALFGNALVFSQVALKEASLNQKSATLLMANKEANVIANHLKTQGFKAGEFVANGTSSFTGKDSIGAFTITIATQKFLKGTQIVELTTFQTTRGKKVETVIFAEDDQNVYKVENAKVKTQSTTQARSSATDCFKQYGKGAISSCSSCINCVKSCVSGKSKKYVKAICSLRCMPSCVSCITNVAGFVMCVFN